ncbi:DUF2017 family protein [Actinotalea ferrariae]|uniref:DUF2017 family protein n=1 Tax=Actinotalea ferrariae TaxID=1386098 RepID=UPI001C8B9ADF|nr:DUF2017 family protein [Actinotalea ferrariae]MBX9244956.1 DUF2017 family protein [Actinotalea ferrariae]
MTRRRRPWTFEADEGGWVVAVAPPERAVLLDVVDEVIELLGGAESVEQQGERAARHPLDAIELDPLPIAPPVDPALRRLLPDASGDPAVAAEFRRLTEADLRTAKATNLTRLRAALAGARTEVVVVPSEAPSIAAALTDVRLVISERLGVRTDEDAEDVYRLASEATSGEPSPRHLLAAVYAVLTQLQESLVGLMLGALPRRSSPRRGGAD